MIIEKLIAENFKKHQQLSVDFTPGKNLITGSNYSGKSTILQALLVGLYGNSMAPGETKDLIHDDAKDFSVFLYLDNGFCIKRSSKNSSVVSPSGDVVVRTHTAVNKWCEEMLETDRKTFMRVFASEQGSPQALLAMEGTQLRNFIEQAIGLGELDKLTKKSNAKITASAAGYNANEELLLDDGLVIDYRKGVEKYAVIKEDSAQTVGKSEEVIELLVDSVNKFGTEYDRQVIAQRKLQSYQQNVETFEGMLVDLPAAVAQEDTTDMSAKLDRDTAAYWKLRDAEKAMKAANKSYDEYAEYLETKTAALTDTLPEQVTSEVEVKELKLATEKVTNLGIDAKTLEGSIETSECPTCHRAFDKAVSVEVLAEQLVRKREEIDEAVAVRVGCLERFNEASAQEQAYVKAVAASQRAKGVIEELENQLAKAAEKKSHATVTLPVAYLNGVLKSDLDNLISLISDTNDNNKSSARVEEQRSELIGKLAALEEPVKEVLDLEGLQRDLTKARQNLVVVREELSEAKVCLAESQVKQDNLYQLLQKNKEVKERMTEFKESHSAYSAISAALKGAREKAIESAFTQTLGIASEFVKACTGGDISEVYLAEAGIRYIENGRGRGTVSASGAQKTLIGLGMKLGLSQIVRSPFGALLLDEISSDMDPDVSTACLTVLGEYCEQAIIVSHTASDVADNVIQL